MTLRSAGTRGFPVIASGLVLLLIGVMIALGLWQWRRHDEKQAAIATMRANLTRPPVMFPPHGPVARDAMFRRSRVNCLRVAGYDVEAGKAADGTAGYRYIARCVTAGAEGPGALVTLGVGKRPDLTLTWNGGAVTGRIVEEPDHRPMLTRIWGNALVLRPMLVADRAPIAGLLPAAQPSPDDVPDNHRGYAVQWFLFAGVAAAVYALALWQRLRTARGA